MTPRLVTAASAALIQIAKDIALSLQSKKHIVHGPRRPPSLPSGIFAGHYFLIPNSMPKLRNSVERWLQWPLWLPQAWHNKGYIRRLVNPCKGCTSIVISMSVYIFVGLSARISPVYGRGSFLLQQGYEIPRESCKFGFSPLTMHCTA